MPSPAEIIGAYLVVIVIYDIAIIGSTAIYCDNTHNKIADMISNTVNFLGYEKISGRRLLLFLIFLNLAIGPIALIAVLFTLSRGMANPFEKPKRSL